MVKQDRENWRHGTGIRAVLRPRPSARARRRALVTADRPRAPGGPQALHRTGAEPSRHPDQHPVVAVARARGGRSRPSCPAGRPSTAVVYALTPYGLELEEPVISLGLWGAKSLGQTHQQRLATAWPRSPSPFAGCSTPTAAKGRNLVAELRFDHSRLHVVVEDGQVSFPPSRPPIPISCSPRHLTRSPRSSPATPMSTPRSPAAGYGSRDPEARPADSSRSSTCRKQRRRVTRFDPTGTRSIPPESSTASQRSGTRPKAARGPDEASK